MTKLTREQVIDFVFLIVIIIFVALLREKLSAETNPEIEKDDGIVQLTDVERFEGIAYAELRYEKQMLDLTIARERRGSDIKKRMELERLGIKHPSIGFVHHDHLWEKYDVGKVCKFRVHKAIDDNNLIGIMRWWDQVWGWQSELVWFEMPAAGVKAESEVDSEMPFICIGEKQFEKPWAWRDRRPYHDNRDVIPHMKMMNYKYR